MINFIQRTINFVYFLWQGRVSLAFTYWIVGLLGNFLVFVLPLFTLDILKGELSEVHYLHLGASFLYFLFSAVCITRAVGASQRPKTWPF